MPLDVFNYYSPCTSVFSTVEAYTTGDDGHASVKGKNAIAAALGVNSTAQAEEVCAIMLASYDDDINLVAVRSSLVGKNGIEAGKKYRLTAYGEFKEVTS